LRKGKAGLGFVERDFFDGRAGDGEVGLGGGGRVVAPGADGVEVGDKLRGKAGGEGFAGELGGEGVGEVLVHGEGDEEGVTRSPGGRRVVEDAELDGEVRGLVGDGGVDLRVDTLCVDLEEVELVRGELRDGPVGGGTDLQGALEAVVLEHGGAEDFGELAGGVAAESIHLEEAILSGDEALCEDEVVDAGGADVGHAMGVALDGDGSGEAGDGEGAVEPREGGAGGGADPVLGGEEADDGQEDHDGGGDAEDAQQAGGEAGARGAGGGWDVREGFGDGSGMMLVDKTRRVRIAARLQAGLGVVRGVAWVRGGGVKRAHA
jgi:hypothetical protein